jgi:hypothetical protein
LAPVYPVSSPYDFSLSVFVKDKVHFSNVKTLQHLKGILEATVMQYAMEIVWQHLNYKLDVCQATNGVHIKITHSK